MTGKPFFLIGMGWLCYAALVGMFIIAVAFLGRRRISWEPWEFVLPFVPFMVWLGLSAAQQEYSKSSGNLLAEPCMIAAYFGVAVILRGLLANRFDQTRLAFYLQVTVVIAAIIVWRFVPSLSY